MDGSGFDALTRALCSLRSRRSVAHLLLGAALGGPPALLALAAADAKRGKTRKRKKRHDHRERDHDAHRGARVQADKKRKACPPCKKRKQGKCKGKLPDGAVCPGGSCRARSCVPTTTPPVCTPSCGVGVCGGDDGCGKSCATCTDGLRCQDGQCVPTCDSGLTDCSGACADLQIDPANCGDCGTRCHFPQASATCQGGVCTLGTCEEDWRNCDDNNANGCETDTRTNPDNCGACGNACVAPANATATCASSTCGFTCELGYHRCDDQCVRNDDVAHCGTGCTPCPAPVCSEATCDGMTCRLVPLPGCCKTDGDCGDNNACSTDTCGPNHTCQHTTVVCPAPDSCQNGVCDPTLGCVTTERCQANEVCIIDGAQAHCCPQSQPLWDGARCVACTQSDLRRCVTPENAVATCTAEGICSYACNAGWVDCGPSRGCENGSPMHPPMCGACDHFCHWGEECVEGNCRCGGGAACASGQICCDGVCKDTQTDLYNCGMCGNVCPGIGQPTVSVACQGGFCSVGCRGQNYDVNNDLSDGCEQLDEQNNHTQETALDLGVRSCDNTDVGIFTGTIYSDYRMHANPPAPGLLPSPSGGAAPLWFKVVSSGEDCDSDLRVELTLMSGTMSNGYQVTVITDTEEETATVMSGSATIALDSESYTSGSTIYFKVERKYFTIAPSEMANFTATFHL